VAVVPPSTRVLAKGEVYPAVGAGVIGLSPMSSQMFNFADVNFAPQSAKSQDNLGERA
jgi:hypothetical protein